MAAVYPTREQLSFFLSGAKKHQHYDETVKIYNSLKRHAYKENLGELITEQRPGEDDASKNYRVKINRSVTSSPITRVIESEGKIRRAPDWNLSFPENKNAKITETETLEHYCNHAYPVYDTFEQWLFTECMQTVNLDPNAYIFVMPETFELQSTAEYFKPIPIIITSDRMIYPPDKGDFCIFQSTDLVDIYDGANNTWDFYKGKVFYFVNEEVIIRYEQASYDNTWNAYEEPNYMKRMPVLKVRAVFKEQKDRTKIQLSRLNPMVDELDMAAMEHNDCQIVKVKTAYPKEWEFAEEECPTCKGSGTVPNPGSTNTIVLPPLKCDVCKGLGHVESPFSTIKVRPAGIGDTVQPVTPPGGIIQRDVAVMEFLDKSWQGHVYRALAAVHMQFLDQTPLTISGDAKEVDRSENENFVYNIAEDLIWIATKVLFWTVEWRYYKTVPDYKQRLAMIPNIPVPESFDLLPVEYLIKQLADAKNGNVSPLIIASLERALIAKIFYNMRDVAKMLDAMYEMNPLPGIDDDQKATRLMNKGITLKDYVISCNIESLVKRALETEPGFMEKKWEEKKKVLGKFAQEIIDENSVAMQVMMKMQAVNGDPKNVPGGEKQGDQQQPAAA